VAITLLWADKPGAHISSGRPAGCWNLRVSGSNTPACPICFGNVRWSGISVPRLDEGSAAASIDLAHTPQSKRLPRGVNAN